MSLALLRTAFGAMPSTLLHAPRNLLKLNSFFLRPRADPLPIVARRDRLQLPAN
jgi:hypothetical protein